MEKPYPFLDQEVLSEIEIAEVKRLRSIHVSLNDTSRQVQVSMFSVLEHTVGREQAVAKTAKLHLTRGLMTQGSNDDTFLVESTGNWKADAALGIENYIFALSREGLTDRGRMSPKTRSEHLDIIEGIIDLAKKKYEVVNDDDLATKMVP